MCYNRLSDHGLGKLEDIEDVASPLPGKNYEEVQGDQVFYRTIICCVFILFVWLTSLDIAQSIVKYSIRDPPIATVQETCSNTYSIVEEENRIYQLCTKNQLNLCSAELTRSAAAESTRIFDIESENSRKYENFSSIANTCSKSFDHVKAVTKIWQLTNSKYNQGIPYSPQCSQTETEKVMELLGQQSTSLTNIYSASIEYSYQQDASVSSLTAYAIELLRYNQEYFSNKSVELNNRDIDYRNNITLFANYLNETELSVGSSIDNLAGCLVLTNSSGLPCSLTSSAFDLYQPIYKEYNRIYSLLEDFAEAYTMALHILDIKVNVLLQSILAFADSVKLLTQWFQSSYHVSTEQICQISSPSMCDYTAVSFLIDKNSIS
jgi:hypothetical protein